MQDWRMLTECQGLGDENDRVKLVQQVPTLALIMSKKNSHVALKMMQYRGLRR